MVQTYEGAAVQPHEGNTMRLVQSNIGFHPAAWAAAKKAAVDRRTSLSAVVNESVNSHLRLGLDIRTDRKPDAKKQARS